MAKKLSEEQKLLKLIFMIDLLGRFYCVNSVLHIQLTQERFQNEENHVEYL